MVSSGPIAPPGWQAKFHTDIKLKVKYNCFISCLLSSILSFQTSYILPHPQPCSFLRPSFISHCFNPLAFPFFSLFISLSSLSFFICYFPCSSLSCSFWPLFFAFFHSLSFPSVAVCCDTRLNCLWFPGRCNTDPGSWGRYTEGQQSICCCSWP